MTPEEIVSRTGLSLHAQHKGLSVFVDNASAQQFVQIPAGSFVMGMSKEECIGALREVSNYPMPPEWREFHRQTYENANPPRIVTLPSFLCGRTPFLASGVSGYQWSVHETCEERFATTAAALSADDAKSALDAKGWSLINEVQWEYVARCGGQDVWAGGARFRADVDLMIHSPHFTGENTSDWGLWGLNLGEWVSVGHEGQSHAHSLSENQMHIRGGGVLHAPWQDQNEAISCHVARRPGRPPRRSVYCARPVITLPAGGKSAKPNELRAPAATPFAEVLSEWEREAREEHDVFLSQRAAEIQRNAEREKRLHRLQEELPDSDQVGTVLSVGDGGLHIVRLPEVNGILRLAPDQRLDEGDVVHVRIKDAAKLPKLELLSVKSRTSKE